MVHPAATGEVRVLPIGLSLPLMLAAALAVGSPPAANPRQIRFTGRTTADATLIKDALRHVLLYGATKACHSLSVVEASILPADYVPSDPKYRVGEGKVIYERWNADLCGRITTFLVHFWPSPEGGTMFSISYPYPLDAPKLDGQ